MNQHRVVFLFLPKKIEPEIQNELPDSLEILGLIRREHLLETTRSWFAPFWLNRVTLSNAPFVALTVPTKTAPSNQEISVVGQLLAAGSSTAMRPIQNTDQRNTKLSPPSA